MSHLLFFYGTECPHCDRMEPLMDKLEKEHGLTVDRMEVWHNQENLKRLESCDKGDECGGVPYSFNEKTGKSICGEVPYDELVKWAKGE